MLIDMHAHTSGISHCCKAGARDIMLAAKAAGIDGLIISNHYQESYVTATPADFARAYADEYYYAKSFEAETGVRLFFGIEVTAKLHENAHILVYGMHPEFVLEHPEIYAYSLEKIYSLVHEAGGLVVQAHPFRGGGRVQDINFLDGVEINCHPLYDATHCDRLIGIAHEEKCFVTCSGDYHADVPYRPVCGTYFPDETREAADIVEHMKNSRTIMLHVHELRTEFHRDVAFIKA